MFMLAAGGAMAGFSAFQAYQNSKAQAAAAMTQYNDAMLKQSMQSGVEMFNNAQANVSRMIANKNIASAALENLVRSQGDLQRSTEMSMSNMAKSLETQNQGIKTAAAAKLGRNSGTYKLAVQKMKETGAQAFAQAAQNKYRTQQDQERQFQNNLAQRDLMTSNQTAALVPGTPPMQANHAAAAISGGLSGFQQGMSMAGNLAEAFPNQKWMQP